MIIYTTDHSFCQTHPHGSIYLIPDTYIRFLFLLLMGIDFRKDMEVQVRNYNIWLRNHMKATIYKIRSTDTDSITIHQPQRLIAYNHLCQLQVNGFANHG